MDCGLFGVRFLFLGIKMELLLHRLITHLFCNSPFDAYGLFHATHSHNPTRYSHIMVLTPHFYAHIEAGPKVFHPPMSKLMWA